MDSTVSAWGNSLGLRIPKAFAQEVGLENGSKVEIVAEKGQLVVRPLKKYSLKTLVKEISPENRYDEFDFGAPQGREIW